MEKKQTNKKGGKMKNIKNKEEKEKKTEIFLTKQEEREREQVARQENMYLMRQSLADARNIVKDEKLMDMQNHVIQIGIALFNKRAEHTGEYKRKKREEKYIKYMYENGGM